MNGCKYIFIQGEKKNQQCNRSCRGNFCYNHKPSKKLYQKEWYINKILSNKKEKILNIQDIETYKKLEQKEIIKLNKLNYNAKYIVKKAKNQKNIIENDSYTDKDKKKAEKKLNKLRKKRDILVPKIKSQQIIVETITNQLIKMEE